MCIFVCKYMHICVDICIQDDITSKSSGRTLLEHCVSLRRKWTSNQWKQFILDGLVTIDCEVCTNPEQKIENDMFIEYVAVKYDAETQTISNSDESKVFII